jgi:hypothetical protein
MSVHAQKHLFTVLAQQSSAVADFSQTLLMLSYLSLKVLCCPYVVVQ